MKKLTYLLGVTFAVLAHFAMHPGDARALSFSGSIIANSVSVTGSVTVSSMSVSSVTVQNNLTVTGMVLGLPGLTLKTLSSSTTSSWTTTSSTLTAIPGMSVTTALSNPANYLRISVSGILQTTNGNTVKLSIQRDSTDLGQGALAATYFAQGIPVGLTITDTPGDTSSHIYSATFCTNGAMGEIAQFTATPAGYFLVEEIAQ